MSASSTTTQVQTLDVSPIMRKVIHQAIEKAQRKQAHKDGVFYLDF